eukprot:28338-Chlamydomonas_euryale.AAC.3
MPLRNLVDRTLPVLARAAICDVASLGSIAGPHGASRWLQTFPTWLKPSAGGSSRIDTPLTQPLPDLPQVSPYVVPKRAPPTETTVLSNGVRVISEATPVRGGVRRAAGQGAADSGGRRVSREGCSGGCHPSAHLACLDQPHAAGPMRQAHACRAGRARHLACIASTEACPPPEVY